MRSFLFSLFLVFAGTFPLEAQTVTEMKAAADAERAAGAAYKAGDMSSFLSQMVAADQKRPNHPRLIYNLAVAYAKNSRPADALAAISRLSTMGLGYAIEKDEDFAQLNRDSEFASLVKALANNRVPIVRSSRSFGIAEKELIAESVAFDPVSKQFFIGSVHQGKIVKIARDGKMLEFSNPADGLWSVLGMKVDPRRRLLWVASSAFPQLKKFKPEDKGLSGVFKYNLTSGKLVGKYLLPGGEDHGIGEVLIGSDGGVVATDSISSVIYKISSGSVTIEPFIRSDLFASLQGITFGRNENEIYVADYSKGIFRIDAQTKTITQLKPANDVTLLGIDGLYFFDSRLIAIQNGINPNRVVSFEIRGDSIPSFKTLEAGHPDFMEPTMGVIIGSEFHYIANSQWPLVNEKAELNLDKLRPPVVLKLDLKTAHKR
jgi:hypothetical protein